jgi:hypothetical protein
MAINAGFRLRGCRLSSSKVSVVHDRFSGDRRGQMPVLRSATCACLFVTLSMLSVQVGADATRGTISVSVTVQPVVRVVQSTHATLSISANDVQRGYVDVIDPVRLQVASNSVSGFVLDVLPTNDVFTSVVVRGLDSDVVLGADGGVIVQRWQRAQAQSLNLKFKFALRLDTQPGEYSWPLKVLVRPL